MSGERRTRRSQRPLPNRDKLQQPRYRASVRESLVHELELLRAMEEAGHLYQQAERSVREFGDALDLVRVASQAKGHPQVRGGGRGELMGAGAMSALAPEPHPGEGSYPTVWGLGPYAVPTVDVEWVGRASQYADDDLIAEVLYPSRADRTAEGRVRALAKVRQMRNQHAKFKARRDQDLAASAHGDSAADARMLASSRPRRRRRKKNASNF
jgi:hypothetical protein